MTLDRLLGTPLAYVFWLFGSEVLLDNCWQRSNTYEQNESAAIDVCIVHKLHLHTHDLIADCRNGIHNSSKSSDDPANLVCPLMTLQILFACRGYRTIDDVQLIAASSMSNVLRLNLRYVIFVKQLNACICC